MKFIVNLSRLFVGGLFIFSGFVKAIDPLGTSYKIGEYFTEFGLMFLEPVTLPISVVMIVLEIVLGVTLLLGYQMKLTSILLLLLIFFFTFLTGYTSITGNVTDCGCFGDQVARLVRRFTQRISQFFNKQFKRLFEMIAIGRSQ